MSSSKSKTSRIQILNHDTIIHIGKMQPPNKGLHMQSKYHVFEKKTLVHINDDIFDANKQAVKDNYHHPTTDAVSKIKDKQQAPSKLSVEKRLIEPKIQKKRSKYGRQRTGRRLREMIVLQDVP